MSAATQSELTMALAQSKSPPIGAKMMPTAKKSGRTVLGVSIGLDPGQSMLNPRMSLSLPGSPYCHAFSLCWRNAVSASAGESVQECGSGASAAYLQVFGFSAFSHGPCEHLRSPLKQCGLYLWVRLSGCPSRSTCITGEAVQLSNTPGVTDISRPPRG